MKVLRETIISDFDNLPLSILIALPENPDLAKGLFQISHGMAEHKERYLPLMEHLCKNDYICFINDHRGHGESILKEEDLGYMYQGGYNAMVEDLKSVSDFVKQQYPNKKHYLFGHSMGSMVVRLYLKKYDAELEKLIVCGSPSANPLSAFGKFFANCISSIKGDRHRSKFLHNLSFGAFNAKIKSPASPNSWLSRDTAQVEKYDLNPKCGYTFTANGFYNLLSLMHDCYSPKGWNLNNPTLPILFIAGEEDPCILSVKDFHKAVDFIKGRSYNNVQWKLYPQMRHEILNEIGKEDVYDDITNFLR